MELPCALNRRSDRTRLRCTMMRRARGKQCCTAREETARDTPRAPATQKKRPNTPQWKPPPPPIQELKIYIQVRGAEFAIRGPWTSPRLLSAPGHSHRCRTCEPGRGRPRTCPRQESKQENTPASEKKRGSGVKDISNGRSLRADWEPATGARLGSRRQSPLEAPHVSTRTWFEPCPRSVRCRPVSVATA